MSQRVRARRKAEEPMEANDLAAEHIELVQQIVNQVAMRYPRHVDRAELWSAGATGLVEASRSYRAETGIPFNRYAAIRIRGAIIDSTRKRDWAVRSLRRRMREVHSAEDRFEVAEGRKPTDQELSELIGVDLDELKNRRTAAMTSSLLHLDQEDPERVSLGDRIEERSADRLPEETLSNREVLGTLTTAIDELPELQRDVIHRYYLQGEMLQSIAESLAVTEARVSQIRAEAVNAMRSYFATLYDHVEEVPTDAPGRRSRAAYLATLAEKSTWLSRLESIAEAPRTGKTLAG
ncbi:MAG: sigma-70 family RNA polymerase sigma factor [Actinomycetota bacterium]|jgi:RNA polymerase sigma factor FliA|nr:sigma-70 family RNA polymerase sigma factor [Actinomycetota bacterium]